MFVGEGLSFPVGLCGGDTIYDILHTLIESNIRSMNEDLPKRKPNRLPSELYQGGYWYFVTICTAVRTPIFVEESDLSQLDEYITDDTFELNIFGQIIQDVLDILPQKFRKIDIEESVIMPDHVHLILSMGEDTHRVSNGNHVDLSEVIGSLKAYTQKSIREYVSTLGKVSGGINPPLRTEVNYHKIWQKSFYDHIIRDDVDLARVRQYIRSNPVMHDQKSHP